MCRFVLVITGVLSQRERQRKQICQSSRICFGGDLLEKKSVLNVH